MLIGQPELLEAGETTESLRRDQQEEASLLDRDKSNEDSRTGGIFRGCFKHGARPAIFDAADGVSRCPECTWELQHGWCERCGAEYENEIFSTTSISDSESDGYDTEDSIAARQNAGEFSQYHHDDAGDGPLAEEDEDYAPNDFRPRVTLHGHTQLPRRRDEGNGLTSPVQIRSVTARSPISLPSYTTSAESNDDTDNVEDPHSTWTISDESDDQGTDMGDFVVDESTGMISESDSSDGSSQESAGDEQDEDEEDGGPLIQRGRRQIIEISDSNESDNASSDSETVASDEAPGSDSDSDEETERGQSQSHTITTPMPQASRGRKRRREISDDSSDDESSSSPDTEGSQSRRRLNVSTFVTTGANLPNRVHVASKHRRGAPHYHGNTASNWSCRHPERSGPPGRPVPLRADFTMSPRSVTPEYRPSQPITWSTQRLGHGS